MRVTVIDDSEGIVAAIASCGSEYMLQVIACDPFFDNEIETEIVSFNPDLIVLDLLLLEDIRSGFSVLRRIKASLKLNKIPVIVCSKYINDTEHGRQLRTKAL